MPRKNLPPPLRTIAEVVETARVRRLAMAALRDTGLSYSAIGRQFNVNKNRARYLVMAIMAEREATT